MRRDRAGPHQLTRVRPARWPRILVVLHWATASLALATAGYALYLLSPPDWSQRYIDRYMVGIGWHRTGGAAVLLLALVWMAVRRRLPRPAPRGGPAARAAARVVHGALAFLLIALPLSGYLADSLSGSDMRWLGGLPMPDLFGTAPGWSIRFSQLHKWAGFTLLGLAMVHVAGALRHRFGGGDPTLSGMMR